MAILIDETTRVLVQGVTGREGTFHAARMRAAGTNVVAGTSPGRAGQDVSGVPVFDTVADAIAQTGADVSVVFVPAGFARDAMIESADAGIQLIVCVTEDIPARDMAEVISHLERRNTLLIGPNGPGIVTPRRCNVGIMPAEVCMPGSVGVVSRSGTLTYEVVSALTDTGIGQSTVVGMGGDPVHGLGFVDCLERYQADPETEAIVLIGEIGGNDEETAAAVHQEARHQAGDRVPRRLRGAARQAHGPRRRHRGGRRRHRRRQEEGPRGRGHPRGQGALRGHPAAAEEHGEGGEEALVAEARRRHRRGAAHHRAGRGGGARRRPGLPGPGRAGPHRGRARRDRPRHRGGAGRLRRDHRLRPAGDHAHPRATR